MGQRLFAFLTIMLGGCAAELAPETVEETVTDEATLGEAESALCKNALSASQEKTTVKLIDDICGDTWCEGDNDFAFRSLQCRAASGNAKTGSCTLELDIIPRVDDPPRYRRRCTTGGFTGFASLVSTSPNGYQSLQPAFYDALSACINDLESKLPR